MSMTSTIPTHGPRPAPHGPQPAPRVPRTPQRGGVPRHVAIIMDGNGRWAQARGLPRAAGHDAGTENIRRIVSAAVELGIEYLTLWAFSTAHCQRPPDEVQWPLTLPPPPAERERKFGMVPSAESGMRNAE